MNKFLIFDSDLGIYRLPLSYSLADLDRIRGLFGHHSTDASIALPQFPPHLDQIDSSGKLGFLVYPAFEMAPRIGEFLEKTITHVRELKGKGYDYQHPQFKSYLEARDSIVAYLSDRLEFVVNQERRLGIFNIFWLSVTKQIITCIDELLVKSASSQKLKYMIHPHLKSMLNQVINQVFEKFAYQDDVTKKKMPFFRGTLKTKLGANFNFNFTQDLLNGQLSLLEASISPLDPLFQIRKILVDDNSEYYISYNDFSTFFENASDWLSQNISQKNELVMDILSKILGLPEERLSEVNTNLIMFEPQIIFTMQEILKTIPVSKSRRTLPLKRKTLLDEIGNKIWNQVLSDYIKLAREFQKAEIIGFMRDRVVILGSEYRQSGQNEDQVEGLKDKITYNFNSGSIVNDFRKVFMVFIDLRGFTQVASGLISVRKLKESLYSFFDPTLDIIDHFNGQIRFFGGDSILATFSQTNDETNDNCMNTIRVGILIQRLLRYLVNEKKLPFEGAGIGIHIGHIEDAYIFKNAQEKIDTVIGLSANITSRLSSGKSISAERKGDPTLIRELQDTLQDILERVKGKVSSNLRDSIVHIFESRLTRFTGYTSQADILSKLPEMKKKPGKFSADIIGGVLDNNGVVISDEAFNEIRQYHKPRSRPRGENVEFVLTDSILNEDIVFWRVGDAVFKGIDSTIPVWGVCPAKGH